jgi:16S rRNA (uracil1498-N3)-methyltransferase
MTRRCFFLPELAGDRRDFDLPAPLSRQLESVLRAKVGESIELLDREGSAWECRITGIRRGKVSVTLVGKLDRRVCESPLAVTLGVGIARPDTMDLVVRQATEMGVLRLAVFRAARSQYGLAGMQAEKRKERWQKIAGEAVCQCGRTKVPEIEVLEDLGHFLKSAGESADRDALKIFALEGVPGAKLNSPASEAGSGVRRILAAIGPEGGWEKAEISTLTGAGFRPVSLGPRILRLETAAVALISSVQFLWGDMGDAQV